MHNFVDRIVADRWTGVLCEEDEVFSPSIDDLDCVIEALDCKIRTLVSLYGQNDTYLCVGGGGGQYVAYASTSDGQLWNLLSNKSDCMDVVLLNAGGQEGDFPARQVVDKQQVLRAARTFLEIGKLDSSLQWEKQT